MNKTLTRTAQVRGITEEMKENRQVEFVISSEAVDSYNTVFTKRGWRLDRYKNNPIVCYQHRAFSDDPDNVIGVSEVFFDGEKLIGRVTFEDATTNPKAEKVFRKVCNGTLKMASITAIIEEARMGKKEEKEDPEVIYFTRQELLEWSIVTIGSNPDALKRNKQGIDEISTELIKNIEVDVSPVESQKRVLKTLSARNKFNINNK